MGGTFAESYSVADESMARELAPPLVFMGTMMAAAFTDLIWRLWQVQVRDSQLYVSRLAWIPSACSIITPRSPSVTSPFR